MMRCCCNGYLTTDVIHYSIFTLSEKKPNNFKTEGAFGWRDDKCGQLIQKFKISFN